MNRRAVFASMGATVFVAGCGGNISGRDASAEEVARAVYRHDGPPEIVLYTMINNRTGSGAHSAMLINAPSQRVIYDPAGNVRFNGVPEIGDVLYGITPTARVHFESAHARSTYRVRILSRPVSGEVAEQALRMVQAQGAVGPALCSNAVAVILRKLPGFEGLSSSWFPNKLADSFARLPGVTERVLREDDSDDKEAAIAELQGKQAQTRQGQ
ncbi:hypothetical protein [Maliponia aquimaris]|uniref:Lipoprotein n=1 Tax=Maliponia aquimaris TaxID=1673631 RepID=A0A238K4C7_9RHOB|nr:hypothetical protein [Maliponia aquimaris]SMX37778.1 hypothetical protein MAA8898_01259 [Maliponia aquimaris]